MSARLPALPNNLSVPDLITAVNDRLRRIDSFPVPVTATVTPPSSTLPVTSPANGLKSPLNFGGVGNGATDDTAAVAQAAALGYLWLPPGYTFVTAGLTITKSDYSVFGGGALMLIAGAGTDLLTYDGSAFTGTLYPGNGQYGHVTGVTLHGNASNQPVGSLGACLVLKNSAYTTVQDCLIYAGSGDGIRLENANGCFQADECNISNNRIFSNGRHGIYAHSTCLPVNTTIAASFPILTTIAASIATGSQTVTPASMAGITAKGQVLLVQNSDGSHAEAVFITALTGTTFTAAFATTKTGPNIQVRLGTQVVTPASMLNITVGSTQIVANSDTSNLEYVVVTAISGTTFTAAFVTTKTGPGITVVSTFGHVGDHVIWGNHCNYNNRAGIRGTYLTSTVIALNNVLTNAIGISLDAADRCSLIGNPCRNNKGSGVIIDQRAVVAMSNLIIVTANTVTDVFYSFTDEDIGLQLAVTGGVGFTVQTVMITGAAAGTATVSAPLGTVGSTGGIGSRTGFGRSKQCLVETNQLHFNGVQTTADELDVFNTDGCVIQGNFLGDTDFTPMAQYGIQLFNCTGIAILGNTFGPTIHGPLLAPFTAGIQHPYRSLGNLNLSDGMQANQSVLPTPALNDYGILCTVSDYQHQLLWIGTQWVWGTIGDSSGQIVNSVGGVLTGGVWHAMDGSSATILNQDGTTQSVATAMTTIAANIAVGSQTVTPATMNNISVGALLTVANSDGSHLEYVQVTVSTISTFTANFTTTKTGPGITVSLGPGYYMRR